MKLIKKIETLVSELLIVTLLTSCTINASTDNSSNNNNSDNTSQTTPDSSDSTETYVVSFNSNGGSHVDSVEVKANSKVTKPNDPQKDGFNFVGWYADSHLTAAYDFNQAVKSSFILYAKWSEIIPETVTVSFISEGEEYLSFEIDYGSTVAKPNDPVKDGYVFKGWYESGSSVQFNFDNEITSNVNLFAKWSVQEYTVTFNLNYNDLSEFKRETEDGFITFVPERNGYVFNGWWHCDGIVDGVPLLNRQFLTSTKVESNDLVLYAEWIEEKEYSNQLDAPVVNINDYTLTWNHVPNAASYQIIITARVNNHIETLVDENTYSSTYNFDNTFEANTYTIKIRARGDGVNYVNSSYTTKTFVHKVLTPATNFSYNSYKCLLQWDPVLNATGYSLLIDNNVIVDTTDNYYDFTDYDAGNHSIKVTATRSGWISSNSNYAFTKLYLHTPTNVNSLFNESSGAYDITWDAVEKADLYKIYINDEEVGTTSSTSYSVLGNSNKFIDNKLRFSVSAFDSNSDYFISAKSEELVLNRKYSIVYELNGGINNELNPNYYEVDEGSIVLKEPVKIGYTFVGWFVSEEKIETISALDYGDVQLTAVWNEGNEYSITFDLDGGELSDTSMIVHYNEEYNLPVPTKTGYTFEGWHEGSSLIPLTGTWNYTSNKTFVAHWAIKSFDVNVVCDHSNYGKIEGNGHYNYGDNVSLTATAYVGRIFNGWYIENELVSTDSQYNIVLTDEDQIPSASFSTLPEMKYYRFNSNETECTILSLESGYEDIENLSIPDYVTSIGENAFKDCSSLRTISISDSVTSIGESAFLGCSSMTSIIIPDTVTSIGRGAFKDCSSLESITLPFVGGSKNAKGARSVFGYIFGYTTQFDKSDSVPSYDYSENFVDKKIGEEPPFTTWQHSSYDYIGSWSSDYLQSYYYYIPESIKRVVITGESIPERAFFNCDNIEEIVVSEGIASIGNYAFKNCSALQSASLPNSITSIGKDIFVDCSSLSSISLPFVGSNPINTSGIGYLFGGSSKIPTSLSFVRINDGVDTIANHSFSNLDASFTVYIPDSVTCLGESTFTNSPSVRVEYHGDVNQWLNVTFKNSLNTNVHLYLDDNASETTSIVIPNNVSSLNNYEFKGCSSIESVVIPGSVTSIGYSAFSDCASLSSVDIGYGVVLIDGRAFENCASIESIVIPSSVQTIGVASFKGCENIISMNLPFVGKSRSSEGFEAVFGIIFGYVYSDYNYSTYYDDNYYSKTFVNKTASKPSSGSGSVWQYSSYTGESSRNIGLNYLRSYFYFIPNSISEITITDCTKIEAAAFLNCSNVTSISIPEVISSIGRYSFSRCSSLTTITIPSSCQSIGKFAFNNCSALQSITLPFIGESLSSNQYLGYIFGASDYSENNSYVSPSLKNITILEGSSFVPGRAFYGCSSIEEIIIPNNVTTIGNNAFYGCSSLEILQIPNNIINILGTNPFEGCTSLLYNESNNALYLGNNINPYLILVKAKNNEIDSCTIEEGCKFILPGSFQNCSLLTSIVIPDSVTSIGENAFYGCSSLGSVTIPNSVTSIGDRTFEGCSLLSVVVLPNKISILPERVFAGCSSLTGIEIPNSVTSIGESAFLGCSSMTSIIIPDTVTSIGRGAFKDCSSLESITLPFVGGSKNSNNYFGYIFGATGYTLNESYVPSSLTTVTIDNSCTAIPDYAFYNCSSLTTINIPNSVTSIGNYAFYGCSSLESIVLPDGITSIGNSTFYRCSSLTTINIPNSVTSIGNNAFFSCISLEEVVIPDGVDSMGSSAFYNCISLRSITLPCIYNDYFGYIFGTSISSQNGAPSSLKTITITSQTSIPEYAFSKCKYVVTIVLPDGVTSIGGHAFYNCSSLTTIILPDALETIGSSAFRECTSLQTIIIPVNVSIISSNCFQDCSSLSSVTLPTNLMRIDSSAFNGCSSLSKITIPSNVTSIGSSSFKNTGLTSITLPSGITSVSSNAFEQCSSLVTVSLPNSVTSINSYAFSECTSLKTINITNNITFIGDHAFYKCSKLPNIQIPSELVSITSSAFSGCTAFTNVIIPGSVESLESYAFGGDVNVKNITLSDNLTTIGDRAFINCSKVTTLILPISVTSIGDSAFSGCSGLTKVYYCGSQEDYSLITIGSNNSYLTSKIYYYSETEPKDSGTYWHYVDNKPVAW